MARVPQALSIARDKPAGTIRIYVLGESAAYGDPQPRYGLARVLEAMLALRHPGMRFEVVNAAMTAINSHAVLPIAQDCGRAGGDIWVVYIGNNEVVGSFGASGVFGSQALPLPLIRASLALKTTRTGQCLERVIEATRRRPADQSEWGGMEMFLGQKVRADSPAMEAVYRNFQRNLADILRTGGKREVGIVLSTIKAKMRHKLDEIGYEGPED